jgi:PAS domain S-box-containing protein
VKDTQTGKNKCREYFACRRRECPVYKAKDKKCWLVSGTHCRNEIQGKFIEKMEICLNCPVFKDNADFRDMKEACKVVHVQFKEYNRIVKAQEKELESLSLELALSLSEVFEALKKISSGDPSVRIREDSNYELIAKLKHLINMTAQNTGEIVDQSHEIAIDLAEHFDVLHRVSQGDLNARIKGISQVELMESLKKITNNMVRNIQVKEKERNQGEKVLREMEALESSLLSAIPHAVIGLEERRIIFANPSVEYVFGWKPKDLIGKSTRHLYQSEREYEEIGRLFYPVLKKRTTCSHEFTCRRKDGRDIVCNVSASVIGEKLKKKRIVVMYEDISKKKMAEEQIVQSRREWEEIFQAIGHPTILMDSKHNILSVNRVTLKVLGINHADEIKGKKCYEVFHDSGAPRTGCPVEEILKSGRAETSEMEMETFHGTFLVSCTPMLDGKGNIQKFIHIATDITELKHAQEEKTKLQTQLLHAQKLEAVGQLAGGIAHDFNNILTAIITYGHFLKIKIEDDHLRNYADHILSLSEKAANLTSSLLAFSRKQIINLRPVDLNEIIRNIEKILFRIIGEDIVLKSMLSGEDILAPSSEEEFTQGIHVMADPGQIEQVIMNLATNARDAMPQGGTLSIETGIVELDNEFIRSHGYGKAGRYVLLCVRDTGTGIDEQTRERIFEPFFTTKETGKGTGLGLAMVYGIIKQHDGFIDVSSNPGKGSTFEIYLPLIHSEIESVDPEVSVPVRGGNETILLAEDDHDVRSSTREILEKFGYAVIEAVNGEEAINRFIEHNAVIQFVLLDMVMPKKGGKEAYEEIRRINPHVKVLFSSGYTEDAKIIKGIPGRGYDVIQKPVHPYLLLKKIRSILDKDEKDDILK